MKDDALLPLIPFVYQESSVVDLVLELSVNGADVAQWNPCLAGQSNKVGNRDWQCWYAQVYWVKNDKEILHG